MRFILHNHETDKDRLTRFGFNYLCEVFALKGVDIVKIDRFQSGMREIMRYIKYSKDKEQLGRVVAAERRFQNVERSVAEIINAATNSKIKIAEGKETVDMCLALQGMLEDSETKGRKEGMIEGTIAFAREQGASMETVKKFLVSKYGKTEDEADALVKKHLK